MKLKYENYMLDKTAPEYLVATIVSLVVHSVDKEEQLWDTYTLVRSIKLTKSQISVEFVDGTEKVVILGGSEPYWSFKSLRLYFTSLVEKLQSLN